MPEGEAQLLGVPADAVRVELGDSSYPRAPVAGGSAGTASWGSAVVEACRALREHPEHAEARSDTTAAIEADEAFSRHAYGALLLEQGRVEEAEAVYAQDLGYDPSIPRSSWHPGNVWSLHGYHECLVRLGKLEPARIVKQQLDVALARADVSIKSSCFCRMTPHAAIA